MENNKNKTTQDSQKKNITADSDLQDSAKDTEAMKEDIVTIDLPDVADIPGQEHVVPLPLGELADTTISSDDEEGKGILEDVDDDDLDIVMGNDADIKPLEKRDLRNSANVVSSEDEDNLHDAAMDNADDDGTPLNEKGFGTNVTAKDLDIPGADLDDKDEDVGEEDEENNDYSLGDNE